MNYTPGDQVVHHKFGLGTVISIEAKSLADSEPRLFYRIDFSDSTVWAPVEESADKRLRPVTPKGQLKSCRAVLSSSPVSLAGDFRKRQLELEERMDQGSIQGLCRVVRDLNALEIVKPLNAYEKKLYTRAWSALVPEWATTSGKSAAEAKKEISECLQQSIQALQHV